jgi:HD-GYP domain-containing protein (c-di-GMP phosphodiesterase class II)
MFSKEAASIAESPLTGLASKSELQMDSQLLKLAEEIDQVEGYNTPHAALMMDIAARLGAQMGMGGADLTALKQATLLHDLGERVMKREYLTRAGELTWEEQLDLWRHPILGEQAAAQRGLTRQSQLLIRWHHEWWNGRGYPDALSGEAIPLGARIIRVTDTYSALLNDRPWRRRPAHENETSPEETAQYIIADYAGIEFDPHVVDEFIHLLNK